MRVVQADGDGFNTEHVGTSVWMAPEVANGRVYDEACDVYSFAMIMYELLCEKLPFSDVPRTVNVQIKASTDENFRPTIEPVVYPTKIADLSQDLYIQLMKQCWAHDPASRPSFRDIIQEMAGIRELTNIR
eukprot:GEZU01017710.1.p1 GENE.GEZU01017710.1~~GEZU01017710.1.p1  ORF type:complete len:131 (+),score=19.52 GEZU01017710.1:161-553(+)